MMLIGQYDSPFVRRVAIGLTLYDLRFEHRPWSVFADAEAVRRHAPLGRVPALVMADGDTVTGTDAILDTIDGMVPEQRRLYPPHQPARRRALNIAALASGITDKVIAWYYDKRFHDTPSAAYAQRCRDQVAGALDWLDADRRGRPTPFWFGEALGHADIAVAAMIRHMHDAMPGLMAPDAHPALSEHCRRLEAMPVFEAISQPLVVPI